MSHESTASVLALADELPLPEPPPATSMWCENYGFWAFAPAVGTLHLHLARNPDDPRLWREIFGLYRPDGTVLVSKAYGTRPGEDQFGAAGARLRCEAPGVHWSIGFHGAVRRTTATLLAEDPLPDGRWEPLELEMAWTATAPPFIYGAEDLAGECWGSGHYEQPGAVSGSVRTADGTTAFSGLGYRDHSRGPRDLSQLGEGGVFCHGEFPSGRSFVAVDVNGHHWGALYDDNGVHRADVLQAPAITPSHPTEPCPVALQTAAGRHEIDVVVEQAIRFSIVGTGEFVCGRHPDGFAFYECPTRCTWDGEVGFGTVERVYRQPTHGSR